MMPETTSPARRRGTLLRWLPFYLLGLLAAALFAWDWALPLSETWRTFLLLPLTGLVCALALVWARCNPSLLASEGVDAKVESDPILEALLAQARPAETWGSGVRQNADGVRSETIGVSSGEDSLAGAPA